MALARSLRAALGALFLLALPQAFAEAQSVHTYVASVGNDAADCKTPVTACRTLPVALANTLAGGKIFILDAADYSTVVIDKSVTITAVGVDATLYTGSTSKIIVAAGPNDVIHLDGLTLRRTFPGIGNNSGVDFQSGGRLHLRNCTIQGFGTAALFVEAPGPTDILVSDCIMTDNAYGVWARRVGSGGQINIHLERVTIAGNSTAAVRVARSPTRLWVSNSTIVHNAAGFQIFNDARVFSFQNNTVARNGVDGSPTNTRSLW